ncbi:MAG TPA: energy-coupling factor transporter transmembrane protein EcfT [Firmicutes bacterium]|nr:energy-coupling factor transporter transmembrane protein EcfT [Bacillota bacterium]
MDLDVRTRLFIAAIFSILAITYQDPVILGALLIILFPTLIILKTPLDKLYDLRKLFYLYLILIIIQSLFVRSGEPLLKAGAIYLLTTDGLIYGLAVVMRFIILAGAGLILVTCDTAKLLLAMTRMKIPYEIVFMIQLGIRFIPILIGELSSTFSAIQLRGADLRRVYKRKVLKVYLEIFTPLVFGILQKAEQLSILLELRGFRRYPERTFYQTIVMRKTDYAVIVLTAAAAVIFIYLALLHGRGQLSLVFR